jgi:hypothetical protein
MDYHRIRLNGAILDALRAYARTQIVPLPEAGDSDELLREDPNDQGELWEKLAGMLMSERERRVAYLLFHCGLQPRQILHCCPQEFDDVHEIYCIQLKIIECFARNTDLIP